MQTLSKQRVVYVSRFTFGKHFPPWANHWSMSEPLKVVIGWQKSWLFLHFAGPTWHQSRDGAVLLASRRYNGSRSRKTKGSLADTLQCNIWRRAQTPHRMTHCLHGGDNHGNHNGFVALSKKIGTSKTDADYVAEHRVLKYLRKNIWFTWLQYLGLHLVYIITLSKFTFGLYDV